MPPKSLPPKSISWFGALLAAALAIDLINNLSSWPGSHLTINSRGLLLGLSLLSPALGLVLWYLVTVRASNVARWITAVLVVLGAAGFLFTLARHAADGIAPVLLIGAAAELLKLVAVCFLFTPSARRFFGIQAPIK
jgi:hypothetical protein